MKTTLYNRGENGIKKWSIWSEGSVIHIEANGQRYQEEIPTGLGGRTLEEQVELRKQARIRRKMDDGFKRSIEELGTHITNQLGYHAPMLATSYKGGAQKHDYIQPKLDGHRCLINENGAYSRRGKPIDTITEIVDSIVSLPKGATLDGELYHHGTALQTIASWAKRRQPNTLKLRYHVYDIIIPDMSYKSRMNVLNNLYFDCEFVVRVPTDTLGDRNPREVCAEYRSQGYEGAIIRRPHAPYAIGKRSPNLIKVKMRHDDEFECVDIEESRDGLGVLVLKTKKGGYFKTLAPGPIPRKKSIIAAKGEYIGRHVTCEYADLTNDGIPFHCVAIRWREDL